jgi:hypothetical protein
MDSSSFLGTPVSKTNYLAARKNMTRKMFSFVFANIKLSHKRIQSNGSPKFIERKTPDAGPAVGMQK